MDLLRLFRTVRHLRPVQVSNRLLRQLRPIPLETAPQPPLREEQRERVRFLPRTNSIQEGYRFEFLNVSRVLKGPADLATRSGSLLWDYHLHYFDGLLAPGVSRALKWRVVRDWLDAVPARSAPAWDPYPTSRRVLTWIKWAASDGSAPSPDVFHSLAIQVRHLRRNIEYHLLGNHIFANAVAITAAGTFFGDGEGEKWLTEGTALLREEIDEQFLDDGAHFELSPTYHCALLEDLLDLIQLARRTGVELPDQVPSAVVGAVAWLARMTRPDGRVPLFNDAAYDTASTPSALIEYAERLGFARPAGPMPGLTQLGPSGYFRYEHGRLFVLGDVGPPGPSYQPGHAHCDILSFELCWDGRPVIVDTGTSTYEAGARRLAERGTESHNTVQIGSMEQSEIWGGFRMARRGSVEQVDATPDRIVARIRAFPPVWARHERSWTFQGEQVAIDDRVTLARGRRTVARLHLHPDVEVEGSGDSWTAGRVRIRFEGATHVHREGYLYAPEFNRRISGTRLVAEFFDALRTVIAP